MSFCHGVHDWTESESRSSYVQYILAKGLIHIWLMEGKKAVEEKLLDLPYFTASYLQQKNPIWLLDCWHAITKKDVSPLYLANVRGWDPKECALHNNHLVDLIDIFDDFGWEDEDVTLNKQLLQAWTVRFGAQDWRTRQQRAEVDVYTLEPHKLRPKLEEYLQWVQHNFPEEEKDEEVIKILFSLVHAAHEEGELSLAKTYADQVCQKVEDVHREDPKEILDQKHRLVKFFQDIEDWTRASEIMEDWFQLYCVDEPKRDLLWAHRALEMAEFVDIEAPIRATQLYQEAIDVLDAELGGLHSQTQEAMRNLALCYSRQGLSVEATEVLEELHDELLERYGEGHQRIFGNEEF